MDILGKDTLRLLKDKQLQQAIQNMLADNTENVTMTINDGRQITIRRL